MFKPVPYAMGSCILGYYTSAMRNFGDIANEDLYRALALKHVVTPKELNRYSSGEYGREDWWFQSAREMGRLRTTPCFVSMGSTVSMVKKEGTVVPEPEIWGAGIADERVELKTVPRKVHALRGPRTAEWLKRYGVDSPDVYGDPGIFFPMIFPAAREKKYRVGIIAHFIDKRNVEAQVTDPTVRLIPVVGRPAAEVAYALTECEVVLASSLHGLIAADAYGIPTVHVMLSDKVKGGTPTDRFKFDDYELGVAGKVRPAIDLSGQVCRLADEGCIRDLMSACATLDVRPAQKALLECCPFADAAVAADWRAGLA